MAFSILQSEILIDDVVATISDGQTESDAKDLQGATAVSLTIPSTIDGSSISFLSSDSLAGSFLPVNDDTGTLIFVTVTADMVAGFSPAIVTALMGVRYIKVKSNVVQSGADALITITGRQL